MKKKVIRVNEKDKVVFAKLLVKITFVMLCISVGIKLLGFNLFGANQSNKMLYFISTVIYNYHLLHIVNFLLLFIQTFIVFRLSCVNKNRKIYFISTIITTMIILLAQIFVLSKYLANSQLSGIIYFLFTFSLFIIVPVIIDSNAKNKKYQNKHFLLNLVLNLWHKIKRPFTILLLISAYQLLVLFLRDLTFYVDRHEYVYNFLLNFDYIILLTASYYIFIKKENNLHIKAGSNFALANIFHNRPSLEELNHMVKSFKENYAEYKKKDKEEQIVQFLYVTFFVIVELVNLGLVIFIANLNHYLIECIFIIIGFMVSRKVFGAFHFKSAITCFVISNISFFLLNSITINTDISFAIPIFLGLALSLGTSLLIKRTNKDLYRGMTLKELGSICNDKGLTTLEMGILIDFYCNRESLIKLTMKYHYSRTAIIVFKREALEKLKV